MPQRDPDNSIRRDFVAWDLRALIASAERLAEHIQVNDSATDPHREIEHMRALLDAVADEVRRG